MPIDKLAQLQFGLIGCRELRVRMKSILIGKTDPCTNTGNTASLLASASGRKGGAQGRLGFS